MKALRIIDNKSIMVTLCPTPPHRHIPWGRGYARGNGLRLVAFQAQDRANAYIDRKRGEKEVK